MALSVVIRTRTRMGQAWLDGASLERERGEIGSVVWPRVGLVRCTSTP